MKKRNPAIFLNWHVCTVYSEKRNTQVESHARATQQMNATNAIAGAFLAPYIWGQCKGR